MSIIYGNSSLKRNVLKHKPWCVNTYRQETQGPAFSAEKTSVSVCLHNCVYLVGARLWKGERVPLVKGSRFLPEMGEE